MNCPNILTIFLEFWNISKDIEFRGMKEPLNEGELNLNKKEL